MNTNQQTKHKRALAILNAFAARELGIAKPKRKRNKPDPNAFADIKRYRREHPDATLREAAIACGRIKP
jgi:hypothetical protein